MVQKEIVKAVIDRGQKGDYDDITFAARQTVKSIEEVAELFEKVHIAGQDWRLYDLKIEMKRVHKLAKELFDDRQWWHQQRITIDEGAKKEAADVLVTVCCFAETQGFDIADEAMKKSRQDIERGVK